MVFEEIIKNTALMVGREDVVNYINYETDLTGEDTYPTLDLMTNLLNLVIRELAGTFIPMVKVESVQAENNKVYYKDLNETCLKVKKVFDEDGNELGFSITPEYLKVNKENVQIEYEYLPPNYYLDSTIGYTEKDISQTALCYGLASEFCICKGNFEEAVMWHDRYVSSICAQRKIRNGFIKERNFVW